MREQEHRSRAYWDTVAGRDDPEGLHGLLSPDARLARFRDAAEKRVLLERWGERLIGRRLLEVGCGGGRWTEWLAPRFDAVLAADISEGMIERARERIARAGFQHVSLVVSSMEALVLEGRFDVVYLGSCLHYMGEDAIDEGMAKIAAHSHPGTLLLSRDTVSTTGQAFYRQQRYGGDDPAIYRPAAWYRALMQRHGFVLTDDWPTYVKPLAWRVRKVLPSGVLQAALDAEVGLSPTWVRWARVLHRTDAKDHRFFAYARKEENR